MKNEVFILLSGHLGNDTVNHLICLTHKARGLTHFILIETFYLEGRGKAIVSVCPPLN